jgi:glycosyltransferase involved in cell wall biosynthesis
MSKVSIVIPSRQEPYLIKTVEDVLRQATGDIEVVVGLDGWWPEQPFPDDKRVHCLHHGTAQGLRPTINACVQIAKGEFIFKLDAHCGLSKGFDEVLKAECGEGEVAIPAKYSLEPDAWVAFREPWHYFYLTWPWLDDETFIGLIEKNYDPSYNIPRLHKPVDEILTFQGSAWLLRRSHWDRLLPNGMDNDHLYFAHEALEIGMGTWLSGGRVKIVKNAHYAHLFKGKSHKRTFIRHKRRWADAIRWSTEHWMQHPMFPDIVGRFMPMPDWPADWQAQIVARRAA